MLSGVGVLGGWALEFLARSPTVDRIVTVERRPWLGPSRPALAMLGAVFQGHAKRFEHHQADLSETDAMAALLSEIKPDVILHSATLQSPRQLMNADLDPGVRSTLRAATFGMWLPWHLLPATWLFEAIEASAIETNVVNVSFPDVVNPALRARFGRGPAAGAGNVEVLVAQIVRYLIDVTGAELGGIEVSLVGSHALLGYGPGAGVPHHLRVVVNGRNVTEELDLATMLNHPEPFEWSKVDVFSLFAASAVKNVLALLGSDETRTHVSGAMSLPGGYPVRVRGGSIELDLPPDITRDEAVAINEAAARWDGIERIDSAGTVVYTDSAAAAMAELGYRTESVVADDLTAQAQQLNKFYEKLTTMEGNNA